MSICHIQLKKQGSIAYKSYCTMDSKKWFGINKLVQRVKKHDTNIETMDYTIVHKYQASWIQTIQSFAQGEEK